MKNTLLLLAAFCTGSLFSQSTIIGTTTYDLQTNSCAKHRILAYADGKVSAMWTGSNALDNVFADRGSYYNSYNGTTWAAAPTARIESQRTGYGELIYCAGKEVSITHDGALLRLYANTGPGTTTWTPLAGSGVLSGMWPVATCPAGTNDIYMAYCDSPTPTSLKFSRSDNGGVSWAVSGQTLPFLNTTYGIGNITAECYQIAVYGSDVYILYGAPNTDLVLLHSPSKGNAGTWTRQVLKDFPIDNYTGAVGQTSDYNADGIADTITTSDSFHKMIITNTGKVHVFSGKYRLLDGSTAAGWSYFPTESGVLYWNSDMATMGNIPYLIDTYSADGLSNPYLGLGADLSMYDGATMTSFAGASYDPSNGNIYLLFSVPVEYTDWFGDPTVAEAQSFRDIYGSFSTNGGVTWSAPVNITNTAISHKENVFASVYETVVNGKIHMIWQQDNEPGTSLDNHLPDPVTSNKIRYMAVDPATLGYVAATCDIVSPPIGLFSDGITGTSVTLHWNAVPLADKYQVQITKVTDPAVKIKKQPTVNFVTVTGLTPLTSYSWKVKTICPGGTMSPFSTTAFFTTGPRLGDEATSVLIFPNPNNGNFQLTIDGYAGNTAEIRVINATGESVYLNTVAINNNDYSLNVPLDNIAKGIYQVIVTCNGEHIVTNVMID